MRVITLEQLPSVLGHLPKNPRVIASGNFATPRALLTAFDAVVPEYRLHMLNAHQPIPDREGVTYETAFVGSQPDDAPDETVPKGDPMEVLKSIDHEGVECKYQGMDRR